MRLTAALSVFRLSRWGGRVLPIWALILGLLIGGLPGGGTRPGNLLPIAIYVVMTLAFLIPLELVCRRVEKQQRP
ncbi:hypothetical protein P5G50_05355 [Leifsonia sp. F6_8S_P_1B]|uniref:Uncharacterized protein n=1 Tax=Leifsonia williamsii TaxID=3035919 RepID=A0ABT8K8S9_9MICO|nr:hypothetical protein [Leifsonia williamsii]MDN4613875.1 hypothetical protein [Leifsonia williamsii]